MKPNDAQTDPLATLPLYAILYAHAITGRPRREANRAAVAWMQDPRRRALYDNYTAGQFLDLSAAAYRDAEERTV